MLLQLVEPGHTTVPHTRHSPCVGIDLGTTHSLLGVCEGGETTLLVGLTPSVVAYTKDGVLVGYQALLHAENHPEDVLFSIKRLMRGDDESSVMLRLPHGTITPVEASAEILKYLKKEAEKKTSYPIETVVLTVPAYFDDAARTATRDAATLAGLKVLRLLNEPTAAALLYGEKTGEEGLYAVYDFGGGTFDFSLLDHKGGLFQVLATGGDTLLGGDDFDTALLDFFSIQKPSKKDRQEARFLRESLTLKESVFSSYFQKKMTRKALEDLLDPLLEKTFSIVTTVLKDAGVCLEQLKGIVLVGGATRTPLVYQRSADFFKQKPLTTLHPDEAVVRGAALHAHTLSKGEGALLLDVCPLSLGIEMMGDLVEKIIYRNSPLPTSATQEFTTFEDNQQGLLLHVVQGERELASECRSLARFELKGIPPLPAGRARIAVTFTLDADGLLTVKAQEKTTGVQQHIAVQPSYGLSQEALNEMLLNAFEEGEEDMKRRLLAQARLKGQKSLSLIQKAVIDDGDLLEEETRASLKDHIHALQRSLEEDSFDLLEKKRAFLEKEALPFMEARMNRALEVALKGHAIPKDLD